MGESVKMRAAVLSFALLTIAAAAGQVRPAAAAPSENGIEGRWTAERTRADGTAEEVTLSFERRGTALAGTMQAGSDEIPLFDVRETGANISFSVVAAGAPYVSIRFSGARDGDEIRLVGADEKHVTYGLTAHRIASAAPQLAAAPLDALYPSQTGAKVAPVTQPVRRPQVSAAASPNGTASGRLDGNWSAEQSSPNSAAPIQASIVFAGNGGTMHVGADDWPLFNVRDTGPTVEFTLVIPGTPYVTIHYGGTIAGDELQLTSLDEGQSAFHLTAHRAAAAGSEPRVAVLNPPSAPTPVPRKDAQPASKAAPSAAAPSGPPAKRSLPALRDLPPNNLAKTPLMGWASRGKLGTDIDDDTIREAAEGLDESHLRALGYTYVEVDEGWQGMRDGNGALHPSDKFPDMKALVDYVHSKQLKFGLQISAAPKSCGGFEGSYGHEAEDAKLFASWGVDYVVADWCGADSIYPTQAEQRAAYQKIAEALRASGRDVVFGISQDGAFDVASWGAKAGANVWHTGPDIKDNWDSVTEAGFALNGKEIFTGPGRINDPGLLQVGNRGMTEDEYRTQLNLWAVLAAPMMLGTDVRIMTRETLALLSNEEVIAIDQDASARQARRVAQNGETEVWARKLSDGSMAVGFFNRGSQSAPVAVSWEQLGIIGQWRAHDVWWHQDIGTANGNYSVFLTGHTSLLLRLRK